MNFPEEFRIFNEKINICLGCDSLDEREGYCLEGGCYVMDKARLYNEHCPLGKW
jgi:hypothetical protein